MAAVCGQAEQALQGDTLVRRAGRQEDVGLAAHLTWLSTEHLQPLQPLAPSAVHPNQAVHWGKWLLLLQDWLPDMETRCLQLSLAQVNHGDTQLN